MAHAEDFAAYVGARMPALMRTAYLLTGNAQDAEDLVQQALVKVVPAWKRIAGSPDAYVRRVMVNESISRWRRHRGRELVTENLPELPSAEPDPTGLVLRQALSTLAPRQRAVIVLRYYEDLTERETAEVLGIAVGTVKSQAREALARLRAVMPDLTLVSDEAAGEPSAATSP